MTLRRNVSIYSDVNQISETGSEIIARDIQAVYQALENILAILRGERLFNDTGIAVDVQLFELGTGDETDDFLNELIREINDQEPRVIVDRSKTEITPDYINNKNSIKLVFQIEGLQPESFTLIRSL